MNSLKFIVGFLLVVISFSICHAQDSYYTSLEEAKKHKHDVQVLDLTMEQIDDSLYDFVNLQRLMLIECKLDSIKDKISLLSNLKLIRIESSSLTHISPDIEKLGKLEVLSVNGNNLNEVSLNFTKNSQLTTISLSDNGISNFNSRLPSNLSSLNLSGNHLSHVPKFLFSLKKLKKLDLRNNKITDLKGSISNFKELEQFYFGRNELSELPVELFSIKSLKVVDVSYNKIKHLPVRNICNSKNLKRLNVKGNLLDKKQMIHLKSKISKTKVIF